MPVPFANSGEKQTIPVASQVGISSGRASFTDGFPPLTRTPLTAGGTPPYGTDFNGILNAITSSIRWSNAGGAYSFDSDFSSSVGGYPKGALLSNSTNSGYWFNTTDANTANPENTNGTLTGWVPAFTYDTTSVTGLAATNVTLTALQAANERVTLAGALTANINLVFPAWRKGWVVVNNCTGAFTVTCKTPSGTGITVTTGTTARIIGDGTNIISNESPLVAGALQKSANLSDLSNVQTALENLTLTTMGIGISTQPVIENFNWQNFAFKAGANYLTGYSSWINPPAGITYAAGSSVNIRVIYILADGSRIGLELTPDGGGAPNFKVYKILSIGAANSRVFTFNQDFNSAIPVPISGGGTGATTVAGAISTLGLNDVARVNQLTGIVGSSRNARIGIAAAASTATFTADQVVVTTALSGQTYLLSSVNKVINLATTGAGGMGTGTVPANGFVAIYAIYNPTTSASALLAVNATSAKAPEVYGGSNLPTGYTASALVSVLPVASSQFMLAQQTGRSIGIAEVTALSTATVTASPTIMGISAYIPLNANYVSGSLNAGGTSSTGFYSEMKVASNIAMCGAERVRLGQPPNSTGVEVLCPFEIDVINPQNIYYLFSNNSVSGTASGRIYINGYSF